MTEAMLVAAGERPQDVRFVVVYAGRPGLVADHLSAVQAPPLVIIDEAEHALKQRIYVSLQESNGPAAVEDLRRGGADLHWGAHRRTHDRDVDWPSLVVPQAVEWFQRYLPPDAHQ